MRSRVSILFLMVTLLATTGLMATGARMQSMGNPHGFVRDYTDIFTFPATIYQYEGRVVGDLVNPDNQFWTIGALVPYENNLIGIHLNRPTGVNFFAIPDMDISRKIEFNAGLMDIYGVRFAMAIDSEDNGIERGAHFYELGGGMSTDMLDLGLRLYFAGASEDNGTEITESVFGMGLAGRYFLQDDDDFTIMALGGLGFESASGEEKTDNGSIDASGFDLVLQLGAGINYNLDENNMFILGIKPFRLATVSEDWDGDEESESWIYIPEYHIGLESRITDWLTGRLGARQSYAFYSEKDDPDAAPSEEASEYISEFQMNLGLAFNFGQFTIDTVLQNDFLFNGPDFIGGNGNGIASRISVTYTF